MGAVYRARDAELGREVGIKVLSDRFGADSAAARRLADEARITAQLQHPGIPPVHDAGTLPDGRPFVAMKLIKGNSLDALLQDGSLVAYRGRYLAVFEQVCQTVAYAHCHRVTHRNLTPSNVMIGVFGEVLVMDWGLAKVLTAGQQEPPVTEAAKEASGINTVHAGNAAARAVISLGTPAYMAPEQAQGAVAEIDERSDVFGLGGILCVILTGHPPFRGDTAESTRQLAVAGMLGDGFARLDACGADAELVALAKRCLAPKREDRPADAGEVARAVAELRVPVEERARQAELDRLRTELDAERRGRSEWLSRHREDILVLSFLFALVVLLLINALLLVLQL